MTIKNWKIVGSRRLEVEAETLHVGLEEAGDAGCKSSQAEDQLEMSPSSPLLYFFIKINLRISAWVFLWVVFFVGCVYSHNSKYKLFYCHFHRIAVVGNGSLAKLLNI